MATWDEAIDSNIEWFPFDVDVRIIRNPVNTSAIRDVRTPNNRLLKSIFTDHGHVCLFPNQFRQLVRIMKDTEGDVTVKKTKVDDRTVIVKVVESLEDVIKTC